MPLRVPAALGLAPLALALLAGAAAAQSATQVAAPETGAAAGTSVAAQTTEGPQPLRIISLGGLTGPAAGAAADIISARELAALHVNRGGGLGGGRSLALELVDVGCAGEEAANAAEVAATAFTGARALAFLGPVCSEATLAAAKAAVALGAPLISDGASTPALTTLEDEDLVFRTAPSDLVTAREMARLALGRGLRRIAVAHGMDDWSEELAAAFGEAFAAGGGAVVATQSFAAGKDGYRAEMQALADAAQGRAGGAQALVLFAYAGGDGETVLADALRIGAWDEILGADGLLDDQVIRDIGMMKLARVSLVAPAPDRETEAWRRYAAASRAAGLDPEAPLAAQGYDAAMVLALALVRSEGEGGAALARAIREVTTPGAQPVLPDDWARGRALAAQGPVNYIGASGPVDFDAAGDTASPVAVWRARPGGWAPSSLR